MTLHHVALECTPDDATAEVRFWKLLGFAEVKPPPSLDECTRWVEREGLQVHLLLADEPIVMPEGHVAVVAEHYGETLMQLRKHRIEVHERARHWGAERCFATSPGGHRIEVMAFPPPPA
jgi:catechol 2,3-dioxygenase-like lactoylglutathione lyase family enzyme